MFNKLFKALGNIHLFNHTVDHVTNLLSYLERNYEKDGNAKDAAIDSIIEILQSHKTTAAKQLAPQPPNTVGK